MWYEGDFEELRSSLPAGNSCMFPTDGKNFFVWVEDEFNLNHFKVLNGGLYVQPPQGDGRRTLALIVHGVLTILAELTKCENGVTRNVFADFEVSEDSSRNFFVLCKNGHLWHIVKISAGVQYLSKIGDGGEREQPVKYSDFTDFMRIAYIHQINSDPQ